MTADVLKGRLVNFVSLDQFSVSFFTHFDNIWKCGRESTRSKKHVKVYIKISKNLLKKIKNINFPWFEVVSTKRSPSKWEACGHACTTGKAQSGRNYGKDFQNPLTFLLFGAEVKNAGQLRFSGTSPCVCTRLQSPQTNPSLSTRSAKSNSLINWAHFAKIVYMCNRLKCFAIIAEMCFFKQEISLLQQLTQ